TLGEGPFVEDLGRKGLGSYRVGRLPAHPVAWSRRPPQYRRWMVLTDKGLLEVDPDTRTVTRVVDLTGLAPRAMIARDDAIYLGMRYFVVEVRGQSPSY